MHEEVLTRAEPPKAGLERLDPRIKVVCALVWAVSVVTVPIRRSGVLLIYALILIIVLALNHRSLGGFARRFAAALPFIVLLTILLPFFKEGQVLWQLGPLQITHEGWLSARRVGACAMLCVAAVCLVWVTTPEPDLIASLRGLGLPGVFVGVIAFMLRYLHVLRPELHRLWNARAARTIGRENIACFRSAVNLLGAFFLRSQDRAVRVADAMAARGYDSRERAMRRYRLRASHALVGGVFVAGIVVLRWVPWP